MVIIIIIITRTYTALYPSESSKRLTYELNNYTNIIYIYTTLSLLYHKPATDTLLTTTSNHNMLLEKGVS